MWAGVLFHPNVLFYTLLYSKARVLRKGGVIGRQTLTDKSEIEARGLLWFLAMKRQEEALACHEEAKQWPLKCPSESRSKINDLTQS
jgi:hypothetical protein